MILNTNNKNYPWENLDYFYEKNPILDNIVWMDFIFSIPHGLCANDDLRLNALEEYDEKAWYFCHQEIADQIFLSEETKFDKFSVTEKIKVKNGYGEVEKEEYRKSKSNYDFLKVNTNTYQANLWIINKNYERIQQQGIYILTTRDHKDCLNDYLFNDSYESIDDINLKPLYVGSSVNISNRLKNHNIYESIITFAETFESASVFHPYNINDIRLGYIPLYDSSLINFNSVLSIEKQLIKLFNPLFNKQHNNECKLNCT